MAQQQDSSASGKRRGGAVVSRSPLSLIKAVFTHDVRLKREPRGLTFVLEPKGQPTLPGAPSEPTLGDPRALEMHTALRAALDATPVSRRVMRHLATVEHHLGKRSALFISDLSLEVLARVQEQLESVIKPPPAQGLVWLRECLADAVVTQQRLERERELRQPPSSFFVDHKMEVVEAAPSDFLRASDEQATQSPPHWAS